MIVVVPCFRLKSLVTKLVVYYQQSINLIPDQILTIMKTIESNYFLKCQYKTFNYSNNVDPDVIILFTNCCYLQYTCINRLYKCMQSCLRS